MEESARGACWLPGQGASGSVINRGPLGLRAVAAPFLCYRDVTGMKLHYYVLDGQDRICRVSHKAMEGLWDGRVRAETLGAAGQSELRLVSVLCNNQLMPRTIYLL